MSKSKLRRARLSLTSELTELFFLALRLRNGYDLSAADREQAAAILQAVCDGEDLVSKYFEPWTGQQTPGWPTWVAIDYLTDPAKNTAQRWKLSKGRVRAIVAKHRRFIEDTRSTLDPQNREQIRAAVEVKLCQYLQRSPTP